jgi:hypothetical protein
VIFEGRHLIVFVHGLAGNSNDLRILKDHIAILFRHEEFLLCKSIEQNTLCDIEEMGVQIAQEVDTFIKHVMPNPVERIR